MPATRRTSGQRRGERNDHQVCPAVKSIAKVGNELRLVVIRYLIDQPMRFNKLMATVETIDPKSLSRVLKYLVGEGIVRRDVLDTQPFSVQYSLTEKGMELKPVIDSLQVWGQRWLVASSETRSPAGPFRNLSRVPAIPSRGPGPIQATVSSAGEEVRLG
jgi:DNA-binding HxlR family transcriptional regulator